MKLRFSLRRHSAGSGDHQRRQAVVHGGRDREPDVRGRAEVHGPDGVPEHAVVGAAADHAGSLFPLGGEFLTHLVP